MGKKNKERWKLPRNEVRCSGTGSTSTNRKNRNRASRAVDMRSWRYTLLHVPSSIEVSGEVPSGNYSQKTMQLERQKLFDKLFLELENKVAKYLRLSGW